MRDALRRKGAPGVIPNFTLRAAAAILAASFMMALLVDHPWANIWGFLAMPLGVVLCFGPGLVVWLKEEYFTKSSEEKPDDKH